MISMYNVFGVKIKVQLSTKQLHERYFEIRETGKE